MTRYTITPVEPPLSEGAEIYCYRDVGRLCDRMIDLIDASMKDDDDA